MFCNTTCIPFSIMKHDIFALHLKTFSDGGKILVNVMKISKVEVQNKFRLSLGILPASSLWEVLGLVRLFCYSYARKYMF